MQKSLVFFCTAIFTAIVTAGGITVQAADKRLAVFADIAPVAHLVSQVGGPRVSVGTLVPANADPHVFEPTPRQVMALSAAKLYFSVDLPLDRQIRGKIGAIAGGPAFIDTTAGIKKLASACGPDCAHEHDHEADAGKTHAHAGEDPHVWLSPPQLRAMAENIAAALEKADPPHEADYRENLRRLVERIDETDRTIARRLAPHRGKTFYVFHPAFAYMAAHYGLEQRAVQVEGRAPSPQHLQTIIKQARQDRTRAVFAQTQFDLRPAQIVANAVGAKVITVDPLAEDVLSMLDGLSKQMVEVMQD